MFSLRILHPNTSTRLRLQPAMHGLIGVLFLFNAIGIYRSAEPNWFMVGYFLLLGLASIAFPFFIRRIKQFTAANTIARLIQAFVCLTGCLYFLSHMMPGIGMLLFLVGLGLGYIGWSEVKIFQPVLITLDNTGITVPATFGKRLIGWNQLNNVILRDDLLTIDFKNNKIMHLEILDDLDAAKRTVINDFSKSRIQ
jgi:protein-S-isoprenylcysteine O-methyltransferase Ste14